MINRRPHLYILLAVLLVAGAVGSVVVLTGHADGPIAASADRIEPLAVGEPAPPFTVETVAGEAFHFNPAHLDRPVMLLTFRGGWCPYCNTYLSDMRQVIPQIRQLGIDVLFLSGDRAALLFDSLDPETQADIDGLGYTLLSDADAQAAQALGIAFRASQRTIDRRREKQQDIEGSSMLRRGALPVPAVFAIDRDGIIRFAYTNADYKVRLPADELLRVARQIAAAD